MPIPSQRAFHFLTNVDWGASAPESPAQPPARETQVSWRGLTAFIDRAMQRLSTDLNDDQIREVAAHITRMSRQIELTIARNSYTPGQMSPQTREQRGWLGFLSRDEGMAAYVRARRAASEVIDAAAAVSPHYPPPFEIHFRPVRGIYKLRATSARPMLWLPTPMIAFDASQFSVLANLIFDRSLIDRQRVIDLMTGEDFQSIRAELEALGGILEQERGAVHDLGESFARVNAAYFDGKMARPRLTWNRTFTGRKFGHYDFILDTVMVSRTLDTVKAPQFVVDFLVFHELLHKFHGIHWVNGRGYAHTAEFYESERKFARYAEAEAILSQLAREAR